MFVRPITILAVPQITYENRRRMFIPSLSPRTIADNSRTVTAVSRGGAIIADFLLVLATWRNLKTGMTYGDRKSLASILLWNGEPTRFSYSATCYT